MLSRSTAFICFLVCFLLAGAASAHATVYYVSPSGSDTNPGTPAQPWKTIQKAASTMIAGDTAMISDGNYAGGIMQSVSGTPGAPITFQAINPGVPVIWGDQTTRDDAFWVYRAHHVVIDGLTIRNGNRRGIRVDNSNGVTVRRCNLINNQITGVMTNYSDDVTIEENHCAYSIEQHGIYVSNGGDRPIVRNNLCYNNARAGIQLNGDGKQVNLALGTRGDGIIQDGQVTGNVCFNNGLNFEAAAMNLLSVRYTLVANNLLYNNLAGGISMGNDNVASETQWGCKENRLLYNTIYFRPDEGRWCLSATNGSTGNVVQNNIFNGGYRGAYQVDASSSVIADHNVLFSASNIGVAVDPDTQTFYSLAEWQTLSGNDLHSIHSDPQFVNSTTEPYDFHLKPTSPAIGLGVYQPDVSTDLYDDPRSTTEDTDPGAIETTPSVSFSIGGRITANGRGVKGAKVSTAGKVATTDRQGKYTLSGVTAGTYTVAASHNNYALSAPVEVTVGPSATGVDFTAVSAITGLTVNPNRLTGGGRTEAKVELSMDAPAGGALVELISSDPALVPPEAVTVPAGQRSVTFLVDTAPVAAETDATLTAMLGAGTVTRTVTVTPPGLSDLFFQPETVTGGKSATGTVRLTGPAPVGGLSVPLTSGSALVTAPASALVPEGLAEGTFTVETASVSADKDVTVQAALGGSTAVGRLRLNPVTLEGITVAPDSMLGGGSAQATVTLTGPAAAAGVTVKLALKKKTVGVTMPATVTIPAGQTSAKFTIGTEAVAKDTLVEPRATLGTKTKEAKLTLLAPAVASLTVDPAEVRGGTSATGTVTLNAPAPAAGLAVTLKSSAAGAAKPPSRITLPAGAISATFTITTRPPKTATTATLSASTAKTTVTATLVVKP